MRKVLPCPQGGDKVQLWWLSRSKATSAVEFHTNMSPAESV